MDWRRYDVNLHSTGGVHCISPKRWGKGNGRSRGITETHVGRRWHLPPQGSQVSGGAGGGGVTGIGCGEGGHGDIVAILELDGRVRWWRHSG